MVIGIGEALGVAALNALYGNRIDGVPPEQQDELATENLILAAEAIAGDRRDRPGRAGQRAEALPAADR